MKSLLLSICYLFLTYSALIAQNVNLTFRVDMSAESVSNNGVHIAGSFQSEAGLGADWTPGSTPMQDADGDNIYELTVTLPPGTYQYKFINGNAWGMDENPPSECSVGNTNNREVTVGNNDLALPAVPFNACLAKLRLAVNMTGQEVSPQGVYVMGDFQEAAGFSMNWDPGATALHDLNKDGTFEVELSVPPGDYQYVFINGNTLSDVEMLPEDCTVMGTNDLRSRSFTFSPEQEPPAVPCFNSCEECHPARVFEYDTEWWNDAVFYEIFVRSFYDSDGDGIGDFRGLIEKLDYLNDGDPETDEDLGITGIWLMPMMPSPSYHGYDVTDYYATEPDYGSMEDFEAFLDAAHQRGIKVIIDFVMNHSSSRHPWFIQSANNEGDFRDWYIWSDTNPGTTGPWGQTIWHPRGGDYFYGLFFSGMPDLNYTHPPVREEMFKVTDFWLDKGVDGYRLDAIKYLIEEGPLLENTEGTFDLLQEFNEVYKNSNPAAFTVGEVWSSTSSIVPYVQNERLDVCFEFGLAGSLLSAVNEGNPTVVEQQLQTVQASYPALQYATFLTNHDMQRAFSVLETNDEKMKLAASLYLTLPGIPFLYYGEEVGQVSSGDHVDIRRPMQWSGGSNAGFSTTTPWNNPGSNYRTNNVANMTADTNSLLHHYRRLIHIRNEEPSLRRGRTVEVENNTDNVFSFARVYEDEAVVLAANLGATPTYPVLSLSNSSLPAGVYEVTELLSGKSIGMVTVDARGGFTDWQSNGPTLPGRSTWILSLTAITTSTDTELASDDLQLRPNPTKGEVQIVWDMPIKGMARVQVFTPSGQLLFSGKMEQSQLKLDTSSWPAGVYYVKVWDEEKSGVKRLIKK